MQRRAHSKCRDVKAIPTRVHAKWAQRKSPRRRDKRSLRRRRWRRGKKVVVNLSAQNVHLTQHVSGREQCTQKHQSLIYPLSMSVMQDDISLLRIDSGALIMRPKPVLPMEMERRMHDPGRHRQFWPLHRTCASPSS